MSAHLTANAANRAIGYFMVGFPVQCHPHRKATRRVFTNYLDACNGLTPGPLPYCIDAFFAQRSIVQSMLQLE
jgi:hypothetical protein